jgi:hypothetical protein
MNPVSGYLGTGTQYVELRGAKADAVTEPAGDSMFAVLHARRDLGEQHIAFLEVGVPLAHLRVGLGLGPGDDAFPVANRRHGDERCGGVIGADKTRRSSGVDLAHVAQPRPAPAGGQGAIRGGCI